MASAAAIGDHLFRTTVCFGTVVVFVVVVVVCAVAVAVLFVFVVRLVPHALHLCFFGFVCSNTQSLLEHNQKPLSDAGAAGVGAGAVRSTIGVEPGTGGARHCFSSENVGDAGAGGASAAAGAGTAAGAGAGSGGAGGCVMVGGGPKAPTSPVAAAPAVPAVPAPIPTAVPAAAPVPVAPPCVFAAGTHVPSTHAPYTFAFAVPFPVLPWTHFPAV